MDIVSSLFFFHNFTEHSTMWSVEHLWSISVEEQFYFVWPLVLFLCMRRAGIVGRFSAAIFPITVLVLSPLARIFFGHQKNWLMHSIGVKYLNFDFIMFGCLVAILQHTPRFESIYKATTRRWWLPLVVIAACSMASARYQNYFNLPIGYTITGAAMGIFLLWCTRNPTSAIGRFLNWAPVVRIGVLSYSIYLWQTLFLHSQNFQVFGPLTWLGSFPANWLGFFLAANVSYVFIEQPSLRLRDRVIQSLHVYASKRRLKEQAR
jgi:peptidoglycan/LPS O-acetylase OafA/YrhL